MEALQKVTCLEIKFTHVECEFRVKGYLVLCVQCGIWIHGRCAGVKSVTPKFLTNFACKKCEGDIGEAVEQEEKVR